MITLDRRAVGIVNVTFVLAVLLHVDRAPPWCTAVALCIVLWRQVAAQRSLPVAGPALRIGLTLALTSLVLVNFRTLNGLEAGSALLMVMGAAKLLELRSRRDALIVIAVAMFLLLAACLDRQSLARLPLYAAIAWASCTALAAIAGGATPGADARASLGVTARVAGRALLYALPLAVLAFLFFPRLPGSLWSMPPSGQAVTGLSDEMSPGSITELTDSAEPAFRVRFLDATPPPQERYFRGPVLHDFDGYTWRRLRGQNVRATQTQGLGVLYRQRITLEPNQRNWWFALDTVLRSPRRGVYLTFDNQLVTDRPVTQPVSYEVESQTRWRSAEPLSTLGRRYDTALPAGRNPRTLAFARALRERSGSDAAFAEAMLAHLRSGGFEYSLTPPRLDFNSVDDLLFRTRLGFCGHFASAYATVMRAGGVPARVVTGYLGGEWNPVGGYFIVRQSDAHAWTEVWLEGRGWTRIDPTAVVSPERLTRGALELLSRGSEVARLVRNTAWLTQVRAVWDAAGTWWRDRVLEFDLDAQLGLLERLGLRQPDWVALTLLLCGGAAAWLAVLTWQLRRAPRARTADPLTRAWQGLDRRLARAGIARLSFEPVSDHIERAAHALPLQAPRLRALARAYAELRYGRESPDRTRRVAALQSAARRLRLPRHAAATRPAGLTTDQSQRLHDALPLYARLPDELRERTGMLTHVLLQRLRFVGCNGLQVTETMRLVIAFQACLLVANRGVEAWRSLTTVLVYPDEFVVQEEDVDDAGVVTEGARALSGQAIDTSRIVLSWQDVLRGLREEDGPGYNVVIHEFAHHLDNAVDGLLSAPATGAVQGSWHDVLAREYAALCAAVDSGADSLIDPYGAEDPAEFFAVATETFFELPHELAQQHPQLHRLLVELFDLDPRMWVAAIDVPARA